MIDTLQASFPLFIHASSDLFLKSGGVNHSRQSPGEAGSPVQGEPHQEIQMGFLFRTRRLCPHNCGNLTESHNVILFTMNTCINFMQFMTAPALGQNPAPGSSICLQHKSWKVCSIQNTLGMFSLSTCE